VAVDCYRRGMSEPLPLFPNFSYQLYRGKSPRSEWKKSFLFPRDGDQLAVRVAFDDRDYDAITELPPRPTDPERGRSRVMRYAAYLYRTIDQSTTSPAAGDADGAPNRAGAR
jgi:hypothetical protein